MSGCPQSQSQVVKRVSLTPHLVGLVSWPLSSPGLPGSCSAEQQAEFSLRTRAAEPAEHLAGRERAVLGALRDLAERLPSWLAPVLLCGSSARIWLGLGDDA